MALTAPALSTWDETIVPSLRKRLESESRILAKRLSVASFSSVDDSPRSNAPSNSGHSLRDRPPSPLHPTEHKSSAIPRPSQQQSRAPSQAPRANGVYSHSLPYMRARTVSQPYLYDPSPPGGYANGHALPSPDSSYPASPRTSDVKPTRIPMAARTRTTSSSSHAYSIPTRTESRNGVPPLHSSKPDTETDPNTTIRRQPSDIMNEPAPFSTASISSSKQSHHDTPLAPPRPSDESEERPFEHWYRGDVRRNGGVGELRVGKRMEMLRIANFGHDIKPTTQRFASRDFSADMEHSRRRKRADSVSGVGERESLYLDEQGAKEADMVFDESPPTDIDGDPETDMEDTYETYASAEDLTLTPAFSASTPGLVMSSMENTRSEAPLHPKSNMETRIPVARAASEPLRANTSIDTTRSSETLIPSPTDSITSSRQPMRSQSRTPDTPMSTKRRAKSPASPSPSSTPRKVKIKPKTPPPSARRKEDNRASIASYPTPEGDGMVDAIPTWTEPVLKSGTWDEVVLPVVARKKGLDGQYEQADGNPRPKPPEPVAPAPGTFGFDYSKYRTPRKEEIPMDEFGHTPPRSQEVLVPAAEGARPPPSPILEEPESPIRPDRRKGGKGGKGGVRADDSAPFSQYRHTQIPTINVTRPSTDLEPPKEVPHRDEDDASAGCCKCIVM